jgi:hypothetical protein
LDGPLTRRVRDAIKLAIDHAADVVYADGGSDSRLAEFTSQPPAVRHAMALNWSSIDVDQLIEGVCGVRIPDIIGRMDGRQFMENARAAITELVPPRIE